MCDLNYLFQIKRSLKDKSMHKLTPVVPPKRRVPKQSSKSDDVPCDVCIENKSTAFKSCLVCQVSYCEIHLTPHLKDPVLMKHKLTDPATFVNGHLCRNHSKPLQMFCRKDQTLMCMKCTEKDHKHHEIVSIEKESKRIKVRTTFYLVIYFCLAC